MRKPIVALMLAFALLCALAILAACSSAMPQSGGSYSGVSASDAASRAETESSSAVPLEAQSSGSVGDSASANRAESAGAALSVTVNDARFEAELADTAAARGLRDRLQGGPVVVSLREYGGFEKVGPLSEALPADDAQITAQPGDIMLYQGDQITIFYGSNSWSYTPLAHIDATADELVAAFGAGDVDVTLSLI